MLLAVTMFSTMSTFALAKESNYNFDNSKIKPYDQIEKYYSQVTFGDNLLASRAASSSYTSTLSMASDAWHCGSTRSYSKDTYKCTLAKTSNMEFYGTCYDCGTACAQLKVEVGEDSIWSFESLGDDTVHFTRNGQSKTAYLGRAGKGKRAFAFTTYSSPIKAGKVTMQSY